MSNDTDTAGTGGPLRRATSGRALRHSTRLLTATGLVAAGALAAGGVAGASSWGSTGNAHARAASPSATATTPRPRGDDPLLGHLLRGTLHAQFLVRTKSGTTETFVFDRGVVRSVSSTTITITPADTTGTTVTATITSKTRFPGLPESGLTSGDKVALVVHSGDAVLVGSRPAPSGPAAKTGGGPAPSSPTAG